MAKEFVPVNVKVLVLYIAPLPVPVMSGVVLAEVLPVNVTESIAISPPTLYIAPAIPRDSFPSKVVFSIINFDEDKLEIAPPFALFGLPKASLFLNSEFLIVRVPAFAIAPYASLPVLFESTTLSNVNEPLPTYIAALPDDASLLIILTWLNSTTPPFIIDSNCCPLP